MFGIDIIEYDAAMSALYSEYADEIAAIQEEEWQEELYEAMREEYMWYKFEDYMLWKTNNNK